MSPASFAGYDLTALCLWRESRGEGHDGMHAVANVIVNRANKHKTSCDLQVMRPYQFTSMSDADDSQYKLFPKPDDAQWIDAQALAKAAKASSLEDITQGSTMYYAPKGITQANLNPLPICINGIDRPFPRGWDMKHVKFQVAIGTQLFFTEV